MYSRRVLIFCGIFFNYSLGFYYDFTTYHFLHIFIFTVFQCFQLQFIQYFGHESSYRLDFLPLAKTCQNKSMFHKYLINRLRNNSTSPYTYVFPYSPFFSGLLFTSKILFKNRNYTSNEIFLLFFYSPRLLLSSVHNLLS